VDNVRTAIEDPKMDIDANTRSLLQKLLGFDNIPRKEKAFYNFVKNSLKIWDDGKIGAMWKVVAANSKPAGQAQAKPNNGTNGTSAKTWPGWKRAVEDELREGAMPWKRLCTRLVARYRDTGNKGSEEELELQALSNIPEGRPGCFEVRTPGSGSGCSGLAEALYVKIQAVGDVVFA
ncbi:unnamed protein product, partial [Effrenium voratum]